MCSDLCGSPCVWGYVGLCTHSARKPQFQCFSRENGWNRQKDQPLSRFTPFLLQWHSLLECTRFTYQWYKSDQYVVRYVRFALKSGVHATKNWACAPLRASLIFRCLQKIRARPASGWSLITLKRNEQPLLTEVVSPCGGTDVNKIIWLCYREKR